MEDSTHAELIARARRLHAILHVAAGHPEDDEQDAAALRRALKDRGAISQLADALEKAVERNAVLEKALEPFARFADGLAHMSGPSAPGDYGYTSSVVGLRQIASDDFRAAAQALSKQGEG